MTHEGGFLVSQVKQLSGRIFERILAQQHIDAFNGAQGRILYVLWQENGLPLRAISQRTGLATTTLTGMIDRMEQAALVTRHAAPKDRRKTLIFLTAHARALQQDYDEVTQAMQAVFYRGFSEAEIVRFEGDLHRVLANLQTYDGSSTDAVFNNDNKGAIHMTTELKNFMIEKTNELTAAPSCCAEAKAAAQAWLSALGTDNEKAETAKYIAELEADIMPIDGLLAFASSDMSTQIFGAEGAKNMLTHAQALKASGVAYCDCTACAAVAAMLAKKDELL